MKGTVIMPARREQAAGIARLIMEAMNADCCRYFCGSHHTLDDFHRMMTGLVQMENSQYSYRNALVAIDGEHLAGALVGYDGGQLHRLRRAFIEQAKLHLGRDFTDMDDETQAGEYYLDSLAVAPQYRQRGIATALLRAGVLRAGQMGLPLAGLLVDQGNPDAERLYRKVGFNYANDAAWGGHPMRHLVISTTSASQTC